MGIKRCPSFSKRPGFPCGLRVLLLDCSEAQRQDCEQRLKECSYEVGGMRTVATIILNLVVASDQTAQCQLEAAGSKRYPGHVHQHNHPTASSSARSLLRCWRHIFTAWQPRTLLPAH